MVIFHKHAVKTHITGLNKTFDLCHLLVDNWMIFSLLFMWIFNYLSKSYSYLIRVFFDKDIKQKNVFYRITFPVYTELVSVFVMGEKDEIYQFILFLIIYDLDINFAALKWHENDRRIKGLKRMFEVWGCPKAEKWTNHNYFECIKSFQTYGKSPYIWYSIFSRMITRNTKDNEPRLSTNFSSPQ